MRKVMLAGALALAVMGSSPVIVQAGERVVITESQIARFKASLRLTAAQERYWAPVEATLRDMARRQAQQGASMGFIQRVKAVTLDAAGWRRLTSAAMPLLRSLDEDQKQNAMHVARSMGLPSIAANF
jgi:hypothetical protein